MPALRQLLGTYSPLLLIDAASARVQVGWLTGDEARWANSSEESGIGIFQAIEALGVEVDQAGAFVFCEGPGSILGIRTAAMAIRTWNLLKPRPVFAYSSLALVAHSLGDQTAGIIADARRGAWHHFQIGTGLRRLAATDLKGDLLMPDGFRHWSPLPAGVSSVPYSLADVLPRVTDANLFLETDAPDTFLHEEPSYVTWTPRIHRAPAP